MAAVTPGSVLTPGSVSGIPSASAAGSFSTKAGNRWLLLDEQGQPAVAFTSFLAATMRLEGQTVSAPVEEGSFAAYNKVLSPIGITCSLGIQGDDATLQAALDTLTALQRSTRLISLVTPNAEYPNLNLTSFNYNRRREEGLGALYVELSLVEIRQVKAAYASIRLAPRKQRGQVRPKKQEQQETPGITLKDVLKGAWSTLLKPFK